MPKIPKISLHIFAISPEKYRDEVDLWPADKHESFIQVDSIICKSDMQSEICPKYPKQQVYKISAISQRKYEG